MNGDPGLKIGCPVCGYGVDWRWFPAYVAVETPSVLYSFMLGYMMWEYLCAECWRWARVNGAEWNGKLEFTFTGFLVDPAKSILTSAQD